MRVLVTGHKGYIGTVLVPILLDAGHEVIGLDSDLFSRCSFDEGSIVDVPEIRRDVRDVVVDDLTGLDAVVHLANLSNDPLGNLDPDLTFEINHVGTVRLARLSKEAGVPRFLFSSSCSLYGAAGQDLVTEEATFHPQTPYGEAKVLAERDLRELADDDFSPTYLRNATAYGMSPRLRFDLVVNNLVAWAIATGRVLIKSDGTPWRPLVHIRDISAAFVAVLEAPRSAIHDEAFNVGRTEENYRIRDVAEMVRERVPNCVVEFAPDAGPDTRSYSVDFSKIERALPDYRPTWTVEKGVEECYDALRLRNVTPEEFEGPMYRRIDQIKTLLRSGALGADLRWARASRIPSDV